MAAAISSLRLACREYTVTLDTPARFATDSMVTACGPSVNSNSLAAHKMAVFFSPSRGRPGPGADAPVTCGFESGMIFVRLRTLLVWGLLFMKLILLVTVLAFFNGCKAYSNVDNPKLSVKSVYAVTLSAQPINSTQSFSGIVRARHEIPIAFQVNGRIQQRHVDAGQRVKTGETLFKLDAQELEQNLLAVKALSFSAKAEQEVAVADAIRYRELYDKSSVSRQVFERVELAERAARAKLESTTAQLRQAEIALRHGVIKAPAPGILMDVSGSIGQVVAAGQAVALLGDDRELEVEVFLPDGLPPPQWMTTRLNGREIPLNLREVAGAADASSRTWRARYRLENADDLKLGMLVSVTMQATQAGRNTFSVPLAAIDERGDGPHIWKIVDQKARRFSVSVLGMDAREAKIQGENVTLGDHIIALGTHLLEPDMAVQEVQP